MVKNIIALDIDQFRVGISSTNYKEIFSSVYSGVKKIPGNRLFLTIRQQI